METHDSTRTNGVRPHMFDVDTELFVECLTDAPSILTDALEVYYLFLKEHGRAPEFVVQSSIAEHYFALLLKSNEVRTKSPMSTIAGIFAVTHYLSEQIHLRARDEEWLKELIPEFQMRLSEVNLAGTSALDNAIFWAKTQLHYSKHAQLMVEHDIRSMLHIDTHPVAGLRLVDRAEHHQAV